MRKKAKASKFATPAQTRRWLKCITEWAKANNKSQDYLREFIGYANRSSWNRLKDGLVRRVKMEVVSRTVQDAGLDYNFINGLYDFKHKFSEVRNIFDDFKETYPLLVRQGHMYQASQIVRKAALFVFETLVPKDMLLSLAIDNRYNEYESAKIFCSIDSVESFCISIYGGPKRVQFTMHKKIGSVDIPVMEGDLDIHAVSAIKGQFAHRKKTQHTGKRSVAKFDAHAKKITENSFK